MSFILDALRRAEAERTRGTVPGLHSPAPDLVPAAGQGSLSAPQRLAPRPAIGLWVLGGLFALGATAALGWWLGSGRWGPADAPAHQPAVARAEGEPAVTMSPPGPVPATPLVASPASPAAAPAPLPAPRSTPAPAPSPVAVQPAPVPAPPPAPRSVPPSSAVASVAPAPAAAAPPPAPAEPVAAPVAVAPRASATRPAAEPVPWLSELGGPLRGQLPPLAVAGGMYSDDPAQRLVILNGQVAREGETVAPGVRLERIRPRSVELSSQGQRFAIPM